MRWAGLRPPGPFRGACRLLTSAAAAHRRIGGEASDPKTRTATGTGSGASRPGSESQPQEANRPPRMACAR